jgi:hypothetical protein
MAARDGLIQVVVGNRVPKTVGYRLEQASDQPGNQPENWRWVLDGIRTVYLTSTPDGAVAISREDELSEEVSVDYEPALVILPARMAMGEPSNGVCRMTVRNLKTGSVRDHGWCNYRIELLGIRATHTPTGTSEAYVVQTRRRIVLQLAQVRIKSETEFVADRGWVAERIHRVTKALGVFASSHTEKLTLAR